MIVNLLDEKYRQAWCNIKEKIWQESQAIEKNERLAYFWQRINELTGITDVENTPDLIQFKSSEDATAFILKWG